MKNIEKMLRSERTGGDAEGAAKTGAASPGVIDMSKENEFAPWDD